MGRSDYVPGEPQDWKWCLMTRSRFIKQVRQYASLARARGYRFDNMIESLTHSFLQSNLMPETSLEDSQALSDWVMSFVEREYFDDSVLRAMPASKEDLQVERAKTKVHPPISSGGGKSG